MATLRRKIRSLVIITSGATMLFTGVNIMRSNEKFYDNVLMPAVMKTSPEFSHKLALLACKYQLFPKPTKVDAKNLNTKFFGHDIKNPIGIAAGFDKQGEAIEGLERIGFGFIEIGSVTPLPQPGNPKPRVFRLTMDKAIINRYGFNSEGHEKVFQRVKTVKDKKFAGVIGVNLGKNKTSENALSDYVKGVEIFGPIADYLVINVSSPNTPDLRKLQGKQELKDLLKGVIKARNSLQNKIPILLKLAPDLSNEDIKDIVSVIKDKNCKVEGLIISNTTTDKSNLKSIKLSHEVGGLSGAPLKSKSTNLIAQLYRQTNGEIPIIGVGGVFSGEDALEKILAGASYVQLYTSFIYHGPPIVTRIKAELSKLLKEQGYNNVHEAVGKKCTEFLAKI